MAQYEMSLHDYWLIVRRRRFIIVVSTLLIALLAFWFSRQRVPVFESTASIRYEQSTSLTGLLVEVLAVGGGDNVETQGQVIKSYPVLEEALRRMGRLPERTAGQPLRESRAYLNALDALAGKIRVNRVAGTTIIEIIVTSANPAETREIADAVADAYRDYNRQLRNARITEARKYIEKQLSEAEARVKRTEEQVWAYREANSIITPGAESGVLLSIFTQLRGTIETTRQQRTELEFAHARLTRIDPGSFADRVFVDTANPALQRLQATQIDLLLEYNNLALEVTERHPRLRALTDRMREVRLEMRREIEAQITLLRNREGILARQMGEVLQKNRDLPTIELGLQRLQRDAKTSEELLTLLRTKYQEALIKESERIEEVSLVRPATDPVEVVPTDSFNTVLVGALLGLMLGLVVAFVQETLDTSIGTIEDVESYLQIPVLGIVPHIDTRPTIQRLIERRPGLAEVPPELLHSHAMLVTHFDPKSPAAEAYRTLRTNIQFIQMERSGKVIVFTSPSRQEGKSTTIVNVAVTMAQNGQRTLLVGANMRRPSIHRFFGIDREPGLSDILVGNMAWRDCLRTVADILMGRFEMEDIIASPGLDNLHIIESGPVPANPSELLSTPTMSRFLREVREEYDVVLVDTPPILPVTDSAIVAAQADGAILVYQSGKVGRLVLKRAKAHLDSARANVWGVVLNDVQAEISGYTHDYTHYYGEEPRGQAAPSRLDRLRGWFRRRREGGDAERETEIVVADAVGSPERSGRRTYQHLLMGVGLVALLATAITGIVGWRMGWFAPGVGGQSVGPINVERRAPDARRSGGAPGAPGGPPASGAPKSPAAPLVGAPKPPAPSVPAPAAGAPKPPAPSVPAPAAATAKTPASTAAAPAAGTPKTPPPAATAGTAQPESPGSRSAGAPIAKDAAAVEMPPREGASPEASAVGQGSRFAVEFGPFLVGAEAERTERRLNEAGYQTVRFRQQTGAVLYSVLIERLPSAREAQAVVATLRDGGFPEATVLESGGSTSVRVGEPMLLRAAVQLAENLRAKNYPVRVAAQPGEAQTFVIRHGNFPSREEAEARGADLGRLGLANHVVRAK